MALKAVLESIDDLDEAVKAEYTERDGKFYLDVADIDNHPKVVALKNAHERTKTEKNELKTKLGEVEARVKDLPEEFSIEEWDRLKSLDDTDPNDPTKRKAKADERLSQLRSTYEQQIAALKVKYDKDIGERDATLESERALRARDKAEVELTKAMDEACIDPKFRDAVRALHATSVKHRIEDDGSVAVFFETDLGEVDPANYMKSWSESDRGKPFVAIPSGPSGKQTGNERGGGINPFAAPHWNKTEQARLRTDPQKGERLARAAGFASLQAGLAATKPIKTE